MVLHALFGSPIPWEDGFKFAAASPVHSGPPADPIDREDELRCNYTCCSLNLQDLHALVEHFEECHLVIVDPPSQPQLHSDPTKDPVPPPNPRSDAYFPYATVPYPENRNENGGSTRSQSSSSSVGTIQSIPISSLHALQNTQSEPGTSSRKAHPHPRCPPTPPNMLHPTLSSWLKNMNKLSDLIDHLQELAFAAPSDHRPQLHRQVAKLRATFKRQQERCIEFLHLSEEYADRYLLDISAEIKQQSSFLEMLEKRLKMAKTLHGEAVRLRKSYESGTMDAMKNVCETALSQPLPEDFDLLTEVHFVLDEIKRCYMELDKFWTEEIRRAIKALETRRVDDDDVERWRGFKTSLEETIESWKNNNQNGHMRSTSHNNLQSSSGQGTNLGTITSSLSHSLGKLEVTLQRVSKSASVAFSPMSLGPVLQVMSGSTQNSKLCLSFSRCCVDFGEIIATFPAVSIPYPTFSRLMASSDLQDRFATLITEAANLSAENDGNSPGTLKFSSVYKQSLSLQRKTTLAMDTLLESVSSWMVFGAGLPNAPPGGFTIGLLRSLADAWAKGRASMRMVLAELTDDPAERLHYRSLSLKSRRPRSLTGWMKCLLHFSV